MKMNVLVNWHPGHSYLTATDPREARRLALTLALAAWLPLLLLSAFQGMAVGPIVAKPFLGDLSPTVRLLLALPMLVFADMLFDSEVKRILIFLKVSDLIPENHRSEFLSEAKSTFGSRDSTGAKLMTIAIAYVCALVELTRQFTAGISSWIVSDVKALDHLSLAGWWYEMVSIPIFQLILLRWLLRFFNWSWVMYRMSRLDLRLVPTHPDGAAGLGIIGGTATATALAVLAVSALFCTALVNQALYHSGSIERIESLYVTFVVAVLIFLLGPFLVFSPQLIRIKRRSLHEYNLSGLHLGRSFATRLADSDGAAPSMVGSDLSALVNFGKAYATIRNIKFTPLRFAQLRTLIIAALLPLLIFAGSSLPLKRVLQLLTKAVF